MVNPKTRKLGLAGLLGIAMLGLMPVQADKAEAGIITVVSDFGSTTAPDVYLYHQSGRQDSFESGYDIQYVPPTAPAVDFYSKILGYDLSRDRRGLDSMSTFNTYMAPRGTTGNVTGSIEFLLTNPTDFEPNFIFADIYKNDELIYNDLDVKQYDTDNTKINIDLGSADNYRIDVGFMVTPEPSTIASLATGSIAVGAFGAYEYFRRKKHSNKK